MLPTEGLVEVQPSNSDGITPIELRNQANSAPHPSLQVLDNSPSPPHANVISSTISRGRSIIVVTQLSGINFMTSLSHGLLTVSLPRIGADVGLPEHLLLWPTSVYALTSGSCLLLAGSIADVLGNRVINLTGCFLAGCFIIASGLAKTGIELIMFRALQGIAVALHLPTSVGIVTQSIPSGKTRNIGFSCLGLAQPLGFSVGLVLGGVFQDTVGWPFGFYLCGAASLAMFLVGIWALPTDILVEPPKLRNLATKIDWVGAAISSACLALFSYVMAMTATSVSNLRQAPNIALLSISLALAPAFVFWVRRQDRHRKPALIPNSLWKNKAFTSVSLMVLLSYGVLDTMELFSSLFFQDVQNLSALQASIRILPSLIVGTLLNLSTGVFVHKIPALYLVLISSGLSAGAPLLMALTNPRWPYWYNPFFAQLLQPLSADVLFTVGMLVVSDAFPERTQALAGGVFNTLSQFGTSLGLTVMAVISTSATQGTRYREKTTPEALMVGYRASFWTAFAWMLIACLIGGFGLRKAGKVGLKRD